MREQGVSRSKPHGEPYNPSMALQDVVDLLDAEIAKLERARALLAAVPTVEEIEPKRGRASETADVSSVPVKRKKKRHLTPEGRARIAAAVKRRWAAQKKAAAQ